MASVAILDGVVIRTGLTSRSLDLVHYEIRDAAAVGGWLSVHAAPEVVDHDHTF